MRRQYGRFTANLSADTKFRPGKNSRQFDQRQGYYSRRRDIHAQHLFRTVLGLQQSLAGELRTDGSHQKGRACLPGLRIYPGGLLSGPSGKVLPPELLAAWPDRVKNDKNGLAHSGYQPYYEPARFYAMTLG